MTEIETDILDELYFVTAFKTLSKTLTLEPEILCEALQVLVQQGYVKCLFPVPDTEIEFDPEHFKANFQSYFFLATKAGLLAHNSR